MQRLPCVIYYNKILSDEFSHLHVNNINKLPLTSKMKYLTFRLTVGSLNNHVDIVFGISEIGL